MVADTLDELHEMADRLGLRQYFQSHTKYPHYDICASKRELALSLGAQPVDRRGLIAAAKKLRQEFQSSLKT